MTTEQFSELLTSIKPTDARAEKAARERLDNLIKPPGSLGVLEDIAARLAAITGEVKNTLPKRRVVVMAADNGVVEEGVSSAPQSVTAEQTINMLDGVTGVAVLAAQYGSEINVIDVGIAGEISHHALIKRKLRSSTGNITREPAMTRSEALEAIEIGVAAARTAKEDGCSVVGVGEMGIGNTTTATAVLAVLLGTQPDGIAALCGRGAGLTDEGYSKKLSVIATALALHHPDAKDPLDVLSKVGGLDIAAMTGLFLGAAHHRLPVVVDGFISIVAALCAARLCPAAVDYMFASHKSCERGYALAAEALGLTPCLAMEMRLGEGSGCPIMFSVMDGACAMMCRMATFNEGRIDTSYLDAINTPEAFK